MKTFIRLFAAALLGIVAAVLVSCGSSGRGLIPAADAGPLQSDFEAVARAAETGNGNCARTESALGKTEQNFLELPATVDSGLHARLAEGISNLRKRAREMCVEPTSVTTSTTSTSTSATKPTSTSATTTPSTTTTTTTSTPTTTPTTPSTPSTTTTTTPNQNGGTEAGGEASGEHGASAGGEHGAGGAQEAGGEGSNVGGASPGAGQ